MITTPQPSGPVIADTFEDMDATALSTAIAAGELSCAEVMRAHLARIAALNPRFNAIVSLRDEDVLIAEAEAADAENRQGKRRGWLHGLPIAIKDLADTAGLRTTYGSPILADNVPKTDCLMVSRIRGAGAIVIGKTNTPEFGLGSQSYNPVFGATCNAYDPALCAGGSSGGAAVSLALRLQPVADGSDMMGSLRNPAAYNNVWGLRPSFGRVPNGPTDELFLHQLASDGPMARSVRDLAQMLDVQAGPSAEAPLSLPSEADSFAKGLDRDIAGLRIGWIGDWDGYYPMEDGIKTLCETALQVFAEQGAVVDHLRPTFDPDQLWQAWVPLRQWSVAARLGRFFTDATHCALLKPEAIWEIENGLGLSAQLVHAASVRRSAWVKWLHQTFADYDVLAIPSAQVFAFDVNTVWPKTVAGREMDTYHRWMEIVIPGSLSGHPIVNVPVGFDPQGRAMGMQLIGPAQADRALLQVARAYERASDWQVKRPDALAFPFGQRAPEPRIKA